ncbi:MAG: PHP domain-containing protein [Coriobacteriia bacterium]
MRADLHVHTLASDGALDPVEVVHLAADSGLDAIAVTDHDSVEGVQTALDAAAAASVTVIAGVELSACDATGRDVHILGYCIDHTDPALLNELLHLRHARLERAMKMIEALDAAGYSLDMQEVLREAARVTGNPSAEPSAIGRSHIARALVEAGHVESVQDAFERLIGRQRPFYVPKPVGTPSEVVRVVREAGGAAVLAHPAVNGADDLLERLVDVGLVGVEVFHPDHSGEDVRRLAKAADELGLIKTGGSDFHGPESRSPVLGAVLAPEDALERLRYAATRVVD